MTKIRTQLTQNRSNWQKSRIAAAVRAPISKKARNSADTLDPKQPHARAHNKVSAWLIGVQEVVRPSYQGGAHYRQEPIVGPRLFTSYPGANLEARLVDLEEGTRRVMGTASLRGWEWGVRLGFGVGSIASFALAFVPAGVFPIPVLATGVLVAATIAGTVIGGITQAVARYNFNRRHPGLADALLDELFVLQKELLSMPVDKFHGQQLRQLRRIELLQKDIEGGFGHAMWQLVYGITNVDPKLRTMFKTYLPAEHPDGPNAPAPKGFFFWRHRAEKDRAATP